MVLSTATAFKNMNLDNGEYVHLSGELLRKYQLYLLRIMEDVISVCVENNIKYCLLGGTLLGSIRHEGFIPWDDDVDMGIRASDLERFEQAFIKKYGDKYWVHTYKTPEYGMTLSRVRLKGSVFRGREDVESEECGFFVDIFNIENVSDNPIRRYIHGFLCQIAGFLLSCRNFRKNRKFMRALAKENPKWKIVFEIKILIGSLLCFKSVEKWATFADGIYGLCHDENSKNVTIPSGRYHYFGEMFSRAGMMQTVNGKFEGHMWCIPADYKGYLSRMYGDYMTPPNEKDREEHILLEFKFPDDN